MRKSLLDGKCDCDPLGANEGNGQGAVPGRYSAGPANNVHSAVPNDHTVFEGVLSWSRAKKAAFGQTTAPAVLSIEGSSALHNSRSGFGCYKPKAGHKDAELVDHRFTFPVWGDDYESNVLRLDNGSTVVYTSGGAAVEDYLQVFAQQQIQPIPQEVGARHLVSRDAI
ncbi:hypothetical protein PGTUg99_002300 [Puccinia graminis f. sp. tritici]|uniref:Uncharacterized protein n=1 Tax=Puccinia graminis f. sp. tritici TaxID=56615 RepID=A0A5B0RC51_PUCGR|nr:hypothetical protein PGTUg99_002300 [Puccinia graminis f. sp. tritici]